MKLYFSLISYTQNLLITVSILMLMLLPSGLVFLPDSFDIKTTTFMYTLAYYFLLFVMIIRPLSDIIKAKWLRPLIILRKGAGVFSATIILSIIFAKIIIDPTGYFGAFVTPAYWSIKDSLLFAHIADISAFFLLITSNKFSKQLLGKGWKRIQRLSYVYFFGSSLYLFLALGDKKTLYFMLFVASITLLAFIKKRLKR